MPESSLRLLFALLFSFLLVGCGGFSGGGGGGGGGGGKNLTKPVTGLIATAGNAEITLTWDAYAGAISYDIVRSTTSAGAVPGNYLTGGVKTTSYTDAGGLTNGTTYYYVVVAETSASVTNPSNVVSATPTGPSKNVAVTVDFLSNIHTISSYIYGGAVPQKLPTLVNPQSTAFNYDILAVRWGGNASSTYNWQIGTANAGTDSFFEDFTFCGIGGAATNSQCGESDSAQFIRDVAAAFLPPITTVSMLPWVAQSPASNGNGHYSFSVARDGPQCHTDPQNPDAGDGIALSSNCDAQPNFLTATSTDINTTYVPLLDDHSQACTSGNCVYRSDWVAALANAFNANPFPHFYEMDNEMDMWGVTHRDIHPNPSGYDEMANVYLTEATKLKAWDPKAVRLGPLSCCWWLYWNGANSNDRAAHAGDDFLPWWLNQIYWHDQISGARSLDVFDIHAFPDATTTDSAGNPLPKVQLQALAGTIYRDYWDPTFVSPSSTINQPGVTSIQPNPTIPFRIPRMHALLNTVYPGTPLAISAWRASFAGESDFSTALADADAYGIMGREDVYLASRWTAPNPANPNFWALKLYTDYDVFATEPRFGLLSVAASHNGDPNLFSVFASVSAGLSTPKIMVINKDPQNSALVQFTLKDFNPTAFNTYTLSAAYPVGLAASPSQSWTSAQYFPPNSATLIVMTGGSFGGGSSGFHISPDSMMVPAGGTVTWSYTGTGPTSAAFDAYEGVPACAGSIALTGASQITVNAGSTPGFCHFTLSGSNGSATQGGWIIVGNPAASLTIAGGNNQSGAHATTLPVALSVNLAPGSSGGANPASGASILFSTNAGTLSNGTTSGAKVIAITNSSGVASVALTLPATARVVTVTAEGPFGLGHPIATFSETSQ